ncbi:MAG: c-type cytochrome [Sulfurovum sp.]|uniref:c-type cytochrome n=1 Tax=Sulfurovum sp. TaxID=1969726 RepID=UPI002867E3FE|nr:c-type cytochrome [Sulfurovum sp.]MCO4846025.1 c-type cytochrome [Sulfurovum sp.]
MTLRKIGLSLFTVSFLSASPVSTIYVQKCASCHGMNGDLKAMGTSKAIKDMPVKAIEEAIINYASGERKSMSFVKGIKVNFMRNYTKEELHEIAIYINDLK